MFLFYVPLDWLLSPNSLIREGKHLSLKMYRTNIHSIRVFPKNTTGWGRGWYFKILKNLLFIYPMETGVGYFSWKLWMSECGRSRENCTKYDFDWATFWDKKLNLHLHATVLRQLLGILQFKNVAAWDKLHGTFSWTRFTYFRAKKSPWGGLVLLKVPKQPYCSFHQTR